MDRSRLYRTEAVVIKRIDFGEADKLLTLYTPRRGKIRVIAKGVRRTTSRLGGHVELLMHTKLLIAKGRNLDVVTQSETANSFARLREDLPRIGLGYYVAELLDRFTEEGVENEALFDLLVETLSRLAGGGDAEMAVRFYEVQLLGHLGYRPQLFDCTRCRTRLEPVTNFFSPESGGALCPQCANEWTAAEVSVSALKLLRALQTGSGGLAERLKASQGIKDEVESLLRSHIRYFLERDLKSGKFLNELRAGGYRISPEVQT